MFRHKPKTYHLFWHKLKAFIKQKIFQFLQNFDISNIPRHIRLAFVAMSYGTFNQGKNKGVMLIHRDKIFLMSHKMLCTMGL